MAVNATLLISGSEVANKLATSPLMLVVYVVIAAPAIASIVYYRGKPGGRVKVTVAVVASLLAASVVAVIDYTMVDRSLYYGAWLSDGDVHVRYFGRSVYTVSLCKANVSLLTWSEARGLLKIRTFGVSDPTAGVHMGRYKLSDGSNGYVVIVGRA